jgi:hypothetical protein
MSSSVRRLGSGETIQIRTGVIQGIGPQGPRGSVGEKGDKGDQGNQGIPGPTGYVDESATEATGFGTVNHNTTAIAAFQTVATDEALIVASATSFTLNVGGWQGTAWIRFAKRSGITGAGSRRVEALLGGTVVAATTIAAAPDHDSDVTLAFTVKPTVGSTLQIRLFHTEGASLDYTSRIWISRIGAGIQGPEGPEGPIGQGIQGIQGPQGPPGSLVDNSTTFADIGG